MILLILLLVIGGIMAYVAQDNLVPVALHLGPYVFADIPLFYVITGSILAGLSIAYLIYLVNSIIISLKLRGKDKKLKETRSEVAELTKRVHQLELENEKLKNNYSKNEPSDPNAL
jgi:putative membrane protein